MDIAEGRLKAWLDGELPAEHAEEVAARVEGVPALRRKAEELRARESRTRELLDRLDTRPPPTARVRAAVNAARTENVGRPTRSSAPGRHGRKRWARRSRWAQAALLVLILAGAASAAIPGSPVREWVLRALGPDPSPAVAPAPPEGAAGRAAADETGIIAAPDAGRMRIEIVGLPSGTEIVVRLIDEEGVGVFGPVDARLELEAEVGRIHARGVAGPIRVELPRTLRAADLLVDGRVYLMKRGDALNLRVSPTDSADTEVRLRAGS